MPKYRVPVTRVADATKDITVVAETYAEARQKARDAASGEDFTGLTAEYEYHAGTPEVIGEVCRLCGKDMPEELEQAIEAGWHPEFWDGETNMEGPVCPDCQTKYLKLEDGEFLLQPVAGEFVSEWGSGHVFRTPCTVNLVTRIVTVPQPADVDESVEVLNREYVIVEGKEYQVASVGEREDFEPHEQAQMFFWS